MVAYSLSVQCEHGRHAMCLARRPIPAEALKANPELCGGWVCSCECHHGVPASTIRPRPRPLIGERA